MKKSEIGRYGKMREIVSILMESAFYLDMPLNERKILIDSLLISEP